MTRIPAAGSTRIPPHRPPTHRRQRHLSLRRLLSRARDRAHRKQAMHYRRAAAVRRAPDDQHALPSRRIAAPRLALRNFTSQWFLVPQGTGAVAILLHQLPYQFRGLPIISQCAWVLTIVLLAGMLSAYLLRVALEAAWVAKQLRANIMETACLASISVAFTTIIQMILLTLVPAWGSAWGMVAYVLWWVNLAMAATACVGIFYVFVGLEAGGIDLVPVAIRLPPIAALTVAAGGGVVCRDGRISPDLELPVIFVSYLCIGAGILLALMCDAAFFVRLFDQSWPKGRTIYSIMIACGPYGQSSFAMQVLGQAVQRGAFTGKATTGFISPDVGPIVGACSTLLGVLLWGYGTFWWAFACIAIVHDVTRNARVLLKWDHSLGAWSLIFPWGVYANAAIELGTTLPSKAFQIWSTVLVVALLILWLFTITTSIIGALSGACFGLDRGWRVWYPDVLADEEL